MKKIISIIILLYVGVALKAQNNEITLVVNGDGQTKETATASALRSAIEQAFGTFVSANTTILNDELVKDEIATVTSGNIKSYKEISDIHNPDGTHSVTVSATVSIGNLISYAQSHGSSAEFAGQTFAMNIKMRELNKKNEKDALLNMLNQVDAMLLSRDIVHADMKVGDPQQMTGSDYWCVPIELSLSLSQEFLGFFYNTLSALSLSPNDIELYRSNNMQHVGLYFDAGTASADWPEYDIFGNHSRFKDSERNRHFFFRSERYFIYNLFSKICDKLTDAFQYSYFIRAVGGREKEKMPAISTFCRLVTSPPYEVMRISFRSYDFPYKQTVPMRFNLAELSSIEHFEIVKSEGKYRVQRNRMLLDILNEYGHPYEVQDSVLLFSGIDNTNYRANTGIKVDLSSYANTVINELGRYELLYVKDNSERHEASFIFGRPPKYMPNFVSEPINYFDWMNETRGTETRTNAQGVYVHDKNQIKHLEIYFKSK